MALATAIGLGLAGVGAIASSSSKNKAADKAAAATTAAADKSAEVIRSNYQDSAAALQPWQSQGLQANALINSALGLTPTQPAQSYGSPQATYQPAQGYQQPNALATYGGYPGGMNDGAGRFIEDYSYLAPNAMGDMSSNGGGWQQAGGGFAPMQQQGQMGPTAAAGGMVNTTVNPQSAFDTFRNSTGYQFRLGEGMNAVNSGWAGKGLLQSGAALKSLNNYGQGLASAEFGNWMGQLSNQQSLGSSAAAAQAGVSQANGQNLASIYMNQGNNLADAAIAKSGSAAGNALSLIGGGIFGLGK